MLVYCFFLIQTVQSELFEFCQTSDGHGITHTCCKLGSNTELVSPFLPLQINAACGEFLLTLNLPDKLFCRNHFNYCHPGKGFFFVVWVFPPQSRFLSGILLSAKRAVGICTLQLLTSVLFLLLKLINFLLHLVGYLIICDQSFPLS